MTKRAAARSPATLRTRARASITHGSRSRSPSSRPLRARSQHPGASLLRSPSCRGSLPPTPPVKFIRDRPILTGWRFSIPQRSVTAASVGALLRVGLGRAARGGARSHRARSRGRRAPGRGGGKAADPVRPPPRSRACRRRRRGAARVRLVVLIGRLGRGVVIDPSARRARGRKQDPPRPCRRCAAGRNPR